MMLSTIRQTFKSLEDKLAKLLQELGSMSPDTVYFKAGADKWLIVEVIERFAQVYQVHHRSGQSGFSRQIQPWHQKARCASL